MQRRIIGRVRADRPAKEELRREEDLERVVAGVEVRGFERGLDRSLHDGDPPGDIRLAVVIAGVYAYAVLLVDVEHVRPEVAVVARLDRKAAKSRRAVCGARKYRQRAGERSILSVLRVAACAPDILDAAVALWRGGGASLLGHGQDHGSRSDHRKHAQDRHNATRVRVGGAAVCAVISCAAKMPEGDLDLI
jgi:hypothetical protein